MGGQIRIIDRPPPIFHPKTTRDPEAEATLEHVLNAYRESLADDRRMLLLRYRLVDIAIKVAGAGSVGRSCWIALMMSEGNAPLFLQIKEAVTSVLEPYAGKGGHNHNWRRVVMGQRLSSRRRIFYSGGLPLLTAGSSMCGSCGTPRSNP